MKIKTYSSVMSLSFVALLSGCSGSSTDSSAMIPNTIKGVQPAAFMQSSVHSSNEFDKQDSEKDKNKEHDSSKCDHVNDKNKDSNGHKDCVVPPPSPTPAPVVTPSPVPTPPSCVPSMVSGAFSPSIYVRSAVGMVTFASTCPSSSTAVSLTANLTSVLGLAVQGNTLIGAYVGSSLVSVGTTDALGTLTLQAPSYFNPAVAQYLPVGTSIVSGTQVQFYTIFNGVPVNCYPCQQTGSTVQGNLLGSATLI